jgi:hypothetical protein
MGLSWVIPGVLYILTSTGPGHFKIVKITGTGYVTGERGHMNFF